MVRRLMTGAVVAASCALCPATASAATAVGPVAISDFATGFPTTGTVGPIGIAVDATNRVFATDAADGFLYRFSGPGDAAAARLGPRLSDQIGGLAFDSDGRLYATRGASEIVELDPETGAVLRVVASGLQCPTSLASDPVSGALYFSALNCDSHLFRIVNPASSAPQVEQFADDLLGSDGIAVGPDGTVFAVAHDVVHRVAGAGSATPGKVSDVAHVPGGDGLAVGLDDNDRQAFLLVNRTDGVISKVDLGDGNVTNLVTGGTRGDFAAVGADGCFYATQQSSITKMTNRDGSCHGLAGGRLVPSTQGTDLPARRRCLDRRRFTFRLHHGPTTTVVGVDVFVNGKRRVHKRGPDIRRVVLRRLPKRRFHVRVVSTHSNGSRLVSVRTYHGCRKSRPRTHRGRRH